MMPSHGISLPRRQGTEKLLPQQPKTIVTLYIYFFDCFEVSLSFLLWLYASSQHSTQKIRDHVLTRQCTKGRAEQEATHGPRAGTQHGGRNLAGRTSKIPANLREFTGKPGGPL